MRWVSLLALAAGCGFSVPSGLAPGDARDAPGGDVADGPLVVIDAPIDAPPLGPWGNPTLLSSLNTGLFEDDPTLTGDLLEIYFDRGGDIYVSVRATDTDPWPSAQALSVVNTGGTETTPEITLDGLELFFSSNRPGGDGLTDIYVATRPNRAAAFGTPTRVAELCSTAEDVTPTTVGSSALVMYLSTTRTGGAGSYDIYRTTRPSRAQPWGVPIYLATLSSAGTETEPWIDPTETTLYLSADGSGGRDLYETTRPGTAAPWAQLSPITELNSGGSEEDPWQSLDGHTMFFSSSRTGNYELYMATR